MKQQLLKVNDLTVQFQLGREYVSAIREVSFDLKQGETLGLAGESGCGKSTVALALMNLLPDNGRISNGYVWFEGKNIANLLPGEMKKIWWKELAMVFQGSLNSLNPVKSVGEQIAEALRVRDGLEKTTAWEKVEHLFELIGIRPDRAKDYPHEFSGGMRQRAMIAMAICLNPKLVIADECTTALDVMIQTQIINLLKRLQDEFDLSMIFINHDLALIADICDRVAVMYAGRIVEYGPMRKVFFESAHPYVKLLLKALPLMEGSIDRLNFIPGAPPRLKDIPDGCSFLPRCPAGDTGCSRGVPPLVEISPDHRAACFKLGEFERSNG